MAISALIVNAYSVENRGDAAIVAGLIHSLRGAGVTEITVAPRGWRQEGERWRGLGADHVVAPILNVHQAPRWMHRVRPMLLVYTVLRSLSALISILLRSRWDSAAWAYVQADLVVSAGGAYLGGPKLGTNLMKATNIALGRVAGKPVVLGPMTISPPSRPVAALLRLLLRDTTVFVRDEPSAVIATSLGLRAHSSRDLAFRSPAVAQHLARPIPSQRRAERSGLVVGWSPRSYRPDHDSWYKRDALEQACLDAIAQLLDEADTRLFFIAQTTVELTDDDMRTVERLRAALPASAATRVTVFETPVDIEEAIRAFGSVDVLLASRLHAGLLALAAGVPALVVGYEPKVSGVLAGLGLGHRVIPPDASWPADQVARELKALTSERETRLTERARELADTGYRELDEVLQSIVQSRTGRG